MQPRTRQGRAHPGPWRGWKKADAPKKKASLPAKKKEVASKKRLRKKARSLGGETGGRDCPPFEMKNHNQLEEKGAYENLK